LRDTDEQRLLRRQGLSGRADAGVSKHCHFAPNIRTEIMPDFTMSEAQDRSAWCKAETRIGAEWDAISKTRRTRGTARPGGAFPRAGKRASGLDPSGGASRLPRRRSSAERRRSVLDWWTTGSCWTMATACPCIGSPSKRPLQACTEIGCARRTAGTGTIEDSTRSRRAGPRPH
jgi:hypothetical protein